ncbi:hypothetical protein LshimejAT787_1402960 [Lyophyllum shimeji]|uniref:Uncharacterized protein n=1 Tax=Lyophyllum shimeji TaxID=47721 RepID=A0A9P3PYF7_LYOSH|nr:hypothetical protein LshimejAT787_1402960 [Lyophyllum shimeji]
MNVQEPYLSRIQKQAPLPEFEDQVHRAESADPPNATLGLSTKRRKKVRICNLTSLSSKSGLIGIVEDQISPEVDGLKGLLLQKQGRREYGSLAPDSQPLQRRWDRQSQSQLKLSDWQTTPHQAAV